MPVWLVTEGIFMIEIKYGHVACLICI